MSCSNFSGEPELGKIIKGEKLLRSMGAAANSAGFCHCLYLLALMEGYREELPEMEQLISASAGRFQISNRAMEKSLENFIRCFWENAAPETRELIAGEPQAPRPAAAEFLRLIGGLMAETDREG